MNKAAIIAKNLVKSYGKEKAVNGVDFSIPKSVCYGFLGPNGAGKSTLMKMIYGASRRDDNSGGAMKVFGYDPHLNSLAIKFISGVVPQDNNLDEDLNVEQNLKIFSRFFNIPTPLAEEKIDELLRFMELGEKKKSKIKQLSGGMKRRLIIARALLNDPDLLILDEPTTGLDPQVRQLIWEKLRMLKRKGMTILLTTHYMEEAFQICDSVLIMNKGEKIMEGNPKLLVSKHIEPYVMEVYAREHYERLNNAALSSCRIDDSTDVIRIYCSNHGQLTMLGDELNPGEFLLRQSNLEDLFLKSTGSTLNARQ
ncbi:ABC transporter, ATP-binding protein [Chitinispirillum alkaliphilum]|nr:ABC transporter, ATP-binding protein [Chitinispirillum alkaliphilum]